MLDITRAFLRDWLDWVERGAPDMKPYNRSVGLCGNSWKFDEVGVAAFDLSECLEGEFGTYTYPFGASNYDSDSYCNTQHLHKPRLAWVRAQLQES
jgi:hypothetical protein